MLTVCLPSQVCSESTGHAEAVQMTYNPEEVGYDRLVDLFYSRHNSTTPDRSGNDCGTQYRSGIYYHNEEQKQVGVLRMKCICSCKFFFRLPFISVFSAHACGTWLRII